MANTYSRKPSLDDARARIARAREHIARLEVEVANIWLRHPSNQGAAHVEGVETEDATHQSSMAAGVRQPVPEIIPILVSEAVHNLRAALDYLIHELSILDSGKVAERTQFPIEGSPDNWKQRLGDWLRNLSPPHQAAIKRLQPFDGCGWTAVLRDISNPDKHRHLIVVDPTITQDAVIFHVRRSKTGVAYVVKTKPSLADESVDVKPGPALPVLFADASAPKDRLLIIEVLQVLTQQVSNVIEAFDPDLQ